MQPQHAACVRTHMPAAWCAQLAWWASTWQHTLVAATAELMQHQGPLAQPLQQAAHMQRAWLLSAPPASPPVLGSLLMNSRAVCCVILSHMPSCLLFFLVFLRHSLNSAVLVITLTEGQSSGAGSQQQPQLASCTCLTELQPCYSHARRPPAHQPAPFLAVATIQRTTPRPT
jgi:hypothetical protein